MVTLSTIVIPLSCGVWQAKGLQSQAGCLHALRTAVTSCLAKLYLHHCLQQFKSPGLAFLRLLGCSTGVGSLLSGVAAETSLVVAKSGASYPKPLIPGAAVFSLSLQYFHKTVGQLLPLAYTLLKRNLFAEIIQSHLASRQEDKVDQLAPWAGECRREGILVFSGVGFGFCVLCVSVGLCPTLSKAFLMRGCLFVLVSCTKLSGAWRGACVSL